MLSGRVVPGVAVVVGVKVLLNARITNYFGIPRRFRNDRMVFAEVIGCMMAVRQPV
jgi:hypothetical protein